MRGWAWQGPFLECRVHVCEYDSKYIDLTVSYLVIVDRVGRQKPSGDKCYRIPRRSTIRQMQLILECCVLGYITRRHSQPTTLEWLMLTLCLVRFHATRPQSLAMTPTVYACNPSRAPAPFALVSVLYGPEGSRTIPGIPSIGGRLLDKGCAQHWQPPGDI